MYIKRIRGRGFVPLLEVAQNTRLDAGYGSFPAEGALAGGHALIGHTVGGGLSYHPHSCPPRSVRIQRSFIYFLKPGAINSSCVSVVIVNKYKG